MRSPPEARNHSVLLCPQGTHPIEAAITAAIPLIRTKPPGSVLTLTDATSIGISNPSNEAISQFVIANKPYVKAAAVVGVSNLAKAILSTLRIIAGRKIAAFNSQKDAIRWLVSHP